MSTKVKKKTTKIKKPKRAPLKLSYTEEEKIELKNKYDDILFHLSNFLSEHSVYEAVPENVKILVFSSELNFYEMIKVFIFEDIYCGLIYNPNLNNYLGLITTRDLMLLYKYIIDNFPEEKIENFDDYLKNIFSNNKINKEKNEADINNKEIINNINIFKHLKNINYLDYLLYVKNNQEFHNINLFSVSLDDNLYETLKKINIKNIHRLLVEDDIKKELRDIQKLREKKKENEKMAIKRKEDLKNKRIVSNAEKTTTANDSDEDKKNIKIDIKKILETNKEDIIVEKSENSKEIIKEDKSTENIINIDKKNDEINNNENNKKIENISISETEPKKEQEKPKKKKIIKKKKIKSQNIQEKENDLKTEEIQSPSPKKRVSNKLQTDVKTICNEIMPEIKEEETVTKTVKKKVKKKIVKNKKEVNLELPEDIDNKIETSEKTHRKMNTNITEFNYEPITKIEDNNRANIEENENEKKTEVKKKKIKKKVVKKKKKSTTEKKDEIKKENDIQDNNKIEKEKEIENNDKKVEDKEINENKEIENNIKDREENNILDKKIEEENEKNKESEQRKESVNSLENIHFEEEMKSYVGIVTNETIFEYLAFNYYSNDMKEFNLSLNELIILGENTFLRPLTNIKASQEKTYNTFNYHLIGNFDIIPIFSEKEIEGFIYPKDFFFFIYNCESDQNLTNNEFLEKLYKDIDDEKPFGKNRIAYLELNDTTKTFYVKELIENLNCSIEKKIVIYDPNDNNKLYLISLKTIFKAIVEFNMRK